MPVCEYLCEYIANLFYNITLSCNPQNYSKERILTDEIIDSRAILLSLHSSIHKRELGGKEIEKSLKT